MPSMIACCATWLTPVECVAQCYEILSVGAKRIRRRQLFRSKIVGPKLFRSFFAPSVRKRGPDDLPQKNCIRRAHASVFGQVPHVLHHSRVFLKNTARGGGSLVLQPMFERRD